MSDSNCIKHKWAALHSIEDYEVLTQLARYHSFTLSPSLQFLIHIRLASWQANFFFFIKHLLLDSAGQITTSLSTPASFHLALMGAESNKGEKEEAKAAENKSGEKEDGTQEVVLKVDMHCEACAKKVARSLRGFKGVEKVSVDCKANKVVVKAAKEVDPIQLQDRVHKKSGRKVDILSPLPLPKPESDQSEPTVVQEDPPQKNEATDPPPPPPVTTVVLQVGMHCEACAQALRRHIRKIPGVDSVQTDVANDLVTVKGVIDDPKNLAQLVNKRTRKHASIVKEDNDKAKPADPKGDDQKDDTEKKKKGDDNKDGGSSQGEDDTNENDLLAKFEDCPTRAYMEYYYSNAPELFSDENPNACTVM